MDEFFVSFQTKDLYDLQKAVNRELAKRIQIPSSSISKLNLWKLKHKNRRVIYKFQKISTGWMGMINIITEDLVGHFYYHYEINTTKKTLKEKLAETSLKMLNQ